MDHIEPFGQGGILWPSMAVYEFRCRTCDSVFEVRRPMSDSNAPAECPDGHDDTVRLLSVFANAGAAQAPVPAGGCGAGCACVH